MRYFNYLSEDEALAAFYKQPAPFCNHSSKEMLSYAAGAALYSPATRQTIAEDILHQKHEGLVAMVFDLEDAIGDHQVEAAEASLQQQLFKLASYVEIGALSEDRVPLLFVRVRNPEQMRRMILRFEARVALITGFFFPKFTPERGEDFFRILEEYNRHKEQSAPTLYGSPILESESIIYLEQRAATLAGSKAIVDRYRDYVLNVRIGATDFSSLFGVRRSVHHTIYDIAVIRDCIADIINTFGRAGDGYRISGPVWEYFPHRGTELSPPEERVERIARQYGLRPTHPAECGLIREVLLDKENGLVGKTMIHPSQLRIVQTLHAVTREEYLDAISIVQSQDGRQGVVRSEYANKMNEVKPHLNWAKRILAKANVYGVLHEQDNFHSPVSKQGQAYV